MQELQNTLEGLIGRCSVTDRADGAVHHCENGGLGRMWPKIDSIEGTPKQVTHREVSSHGAGVQHEDERRTIRTHGRGSLRGLLQSMTGEV